MHAIRSGLGTVTAFGADGWGSLLPSPADAGEPGEEVPFHSTAIVDGSRTIEVGCRVRYRMVPGSQGRWEATEVQPIGAVPAITR